MPSHWFKGPRGPRHVGLREGFRSGLEEANAAHLKANGIKYTFELVKLKYLIPAKVHTYTPDFELLANGILVETKGRFLPVDRAKHLYVKLQHPGLDIRMVFQNPNARVSPKNRNSITYAEWADKHGIKWAKKLIPLDWAREPGKPGGDRGARTVAVPPEAQDLFANLARQPRPARARPPSGLPKG